MAIKNPVTSVTGFFFLLTLILFQKTKGSLKATELFMTFFV